MKYSDQQRIAKMRETVEKLLRYVSEEGITPDRIFAEETIQWTVTTPLYNIGEHAAIHLNVAECGDDVLINPALI